MLALRFEHKALRRIPSCPGTIFSFRDLHLSHQLLGLYWEPLASSLKTFELWLKQLMVKSNIC